MLNPKEYLNDFITYCTEGYKLLRKYRDENVTDIPIDDWFKKRLGDEGFSVWQRMRFKREKDDLHLILDATTIAIFNVSDGHYNQLSAPERKEFERKELFRRQYGFWIELPSFKYLNQSEKHKKELTNKFYGKVQLLTGTDYFKLNYLKLVDNEARDIAVLDYLRKSAQFFDVLECLERYDTHGRDREGILVFKPRGIKFTSDVNAFLINRMFMPHRYSIVSTIDSGKKTGESMNDKVDVPISEMPKWLFWKFRPEKKTKASDNSIFRMSSFDEDNKKYESHYKIRNAKPNAFDGERAGVCYCDEIGLYEYELAKIFSKARATLIDSRRKVSGLFIGGGTSDSNNKNVEVLKKMAFNPEAHKVFTYFIGTQYHSLLNPETGYANQQTVIDEIIAERENLSQHSTASQIIEHFSINAININDCFYVKGATQIDIIRIGKQLTNIAIKSQNGEFEIHRGWLHPTYKELREDRNTKRLYTINHILNPEWHPDPKGGWFIVEMPDKNLKKDKPEHFYFAGADNFNKSLMDDEAAKINEGTLKRSKLAMMILKSFTKSPIAMYLYRHADPKEDYYQTLLGMLYYNCYMFPETNKENHADFFSPRAGDNLFGLISAGGFANYLYPTPMRFRKRRIGWQVGMDTGQSKNELYQEHIVPYFDKYTEEIYIERLLNACASWDIENKNNTPDEGMALLMALIGLDDMNRSKNRMAIRSKLGNKNPYDYIKKTYVGAGVRI